MHSSIDLWRCYVCGLFHEPDSWWNARVAENTAEGIKTIEVRICHSCVENIRGDARDQEPRPGFKTPAPLDQEG